MMEAKYTFHHLPQWKSRALEDPKTKELLEKWSMNGRLIMQAYNFNESFESYQRNDFTQSFMHSPEVASTLLRVTGYDQCQPVGVTATRIKVEPVSCTVTSLNFFDPLYSGGVVRDSGAIKKCFDETHDDIIVSDELRKMFLSEESDFIELFSEEGRNEFIFHLLKHISIGGKLCQYEDTIQPYLDVVKSLYKDFVTVIKDDEREELRVTSNVFRIYAYNGDTPYYPEDPDHVQNFAYLSIDSDKRCVKTLCHSFR